MTERQKYLVLASGLAVLAIGTICFPEDAPVSVEAGNLQGQMPREDGRTDDSCGERRKILGMEAAAEGKTLKDPFTLLHEERGQAKDAKAEEAPKPAPPQTAAAAPHPAREAKLSKPAQKPKEEWALKGVVSGAEGRLAIVSNGKETRTVAAGEQFGNRVVQAIDEDSLRFSEGNSEGKMSLPDL